MNRLNLVNIKQEFDNDQQQDNEVPEVSQDSKSPNDRIKLEVDDELKDVPINAQQQLKRKCNKVNMKLEWNDDEFDYNDCRVKRYVKIELNKSIVTARLCKRVKKEGDDDDGKWDEDCFCDDCNRNHEKAMRLEQSNRTERQQTNCLELANCENGAQYRGDGDAVGEDGESDGVETKAVNEDSQNERDQLVVDRAEWPVNVQMNEYILNHVDLIEGGQSGQGQGQNDDKAQINDESDDDEAEVDDQSGPKPEKHLSRNNKSRAGKFINKSPSPSGLTIHSQTNTSERPYKCSWISCNKEFARKHAMNRHYRIHTGERPFKCTWNNCTMKFNQKWHMQVHYRTHTGELPFKCPWKSCTMKFNQKGNMQTHYKIHTGERRFKCCWKRCTEEFVSKQNMQRHYMTHTGKGPFKCPWNNCTKEFYQKQEMQSHYMTHIGQRSFNFLWERCTEEFAQKHVLKIHYRTKTGERPFKCCLERCTEEFVSKQNMLRHYMTHLGTAIQVSLSQ